MNRPSLAHVCALLCVISACSATGGAGPADAATVDTGGSADAPIAEAGADLAAQPPFDWCDGLPATPACYASRRDPAGEQVSLARAIADRYLDVYPPADWPWTWEMAVAGVGFYELYRVTGEARYLQALKDWIDHHRQAGYDIVNSDTCSPVQSAVFLYMQTGDPAYRAVVDDGLAYLDQVATRTPQGGLNHWGASPNATLWVDSLFMFGGLLTRWGEFVPDAARLDQMGGQFRIFTELLQSAGGLYVHAYNWASVDDSIYWGRGNGWVAAAGYDYLRARRDRGEADPEVEAALAKQASAILATQDAASGQWWIVLNRPGETYLETSTGALFAYGLARGWRYGYLGDEVLPAIRRAVQGVTGALTRDDQDRPVVSGVSAGTSAGGFAYYKGIPVKDDLGYGVGAVLLALIETSGLPTP